LAAASSDCLSFIYSDSQENSPINLHLNDLLVSKIEGARH